MEIWDLKLYFISILIYYKVEDLLKISSDSWLLPMSGQIPKPGFKIKAKSV